MDGLNSDLILHIAQYVPVVDAAAWVQASRRYYYLIHNMRRVLGPEMVASASSNPVKSALAQLRQCPNLALCCNNLTSTFGEEVAGRLPPDAVVLGATSDDVQSCIGGEVECSSPANMLLGNLGSEANVKPFDWQTQGSRPMQWDETMENEVIEKFPKSEPYEVFIIYCCGEGTGVLEEFIQTIQSRHPNAALVGGICAAGYVSVEVDLPSMTPGMLRSKRVSVLKQMFRNLGGSEQFLATLTEKQALVDQVYQLLRKRRYVLDPHIENGIFGVALSGNVPVRSVVSRGVKRLTPPDLNLVIRESRILGPYVTHDWQQHALFQRPNDQTTLTVIPPFHAVDTIIDSDTRASWDLISFLAACNSRGEGADFCGIRRKRSSSTGSDADDYEDAFELYGLRLHSGNKIRIPAMNSAFVGSALPPSSLQQLQEATRAEEGSLDEAQIDFFALDGQACVEHVEATMEQLKKQTEHDKDNLLAAMMFSCNGRGPSPGFLIRESMADAKSFTRAFGSDVPCTGFYCGGEIGPLATASPPNAPAKNPFQRGKAALQGFTAVFALFIAPEVDLGNIQIDDSPEHVYEFIRKHLG